MALSNYGELKTAVATLLDRSDLTASIPDFIAMLEARVNREVKFRNRRMETVTTLAYNATDEADLPADFIEARSTVWQSTPRRVLTYQTPAQFETDHPTDTPSLPDNFTIVGNTLKIGPFPSGTEGVELRYYQRLTSLSGDTDTNWLLTYHPDVYLYGAALASAPHLGDDNRLQVWMGLYDRAAAEVQGDDARARYNGAPLSPALSVSVV